MKFFESYAQKMKVLFILTFWVINTLISLDRKVVLISALRSRE